MARKKQVSKPVEGRGTLVSASQPELVATQVSEVHAPDGGVGLVMVDNMGVVYVWANTGWKKLSMIEVNDVEAANSDPKV